MIYKSKCGGVTKVESDLNKSTRMKIAYGVRGGIVSKEFEFFDLPEELRTDFAAIVNKIARHVDGGLGQG